VETGASVTNAYHLYLPYIANTGGSVTNYYGLYISGYGYPDTATNQYAICTVQGKIVFNESGNATADVRMEGDTEANLFFLDASADAIGIGTSSPTTVPLHLVKQDASCSLGMNTYSDGTYASSTYYRAARGTIASPTVVADGDVVGDISYSAYDGSAFRALARIRVEVDGTPGASDMPGRMTFWTTPDGSVTPVSRMKIGNDGSVIVNDGGISTADVRMEGDTDTNLFFLDASADQVVFGAAAGTATSKVEIVGADDSIALIVKVNATQANVTASDTFVDFRSTTGSEGGIAGTAVAGVLAYNTFLGAHYVQFVGDRRKLEPGMLLENTGERADEPTVQEREVEVTDIPEIVREDGVIEKCAPQKRKTKRLFKAAAKSQTMKAKICKTRQSTAAYGVWLGQDKEGRDLCGCVGLGVATVANEGQDIGLHDYLVSSNVLGALERQDDDLLHNYTIGKAMEPIVWKPGEKTRQIVVTFHCG